MVEMTLTFSPQEHLEESEQPGALQGSTAGASTPPSFSLFLSQKMRATNYGGSKNRRQSHTNDRFHFISVHYWKRRQIVALRPKSL